MMLFEVKETHTRWTRVCENLAGDIRVQKITGTEVSPTCHKASPLWSSTQHLRILTSLMQSESSLQFKAGMNKIYVTTCKTNYRTVISTVIIN